MTTSPPGDDSFDVDRAVQDALDRLTLVANATEVLSSTLDLEEGLRRLCRVLVPALADWCAIDLAENEGTLRRAVVEHREQDVPPAAFLTFLEGRLPRPDALHRADLRAYGHLDAHSAVLVPLRARHRVLGVLTLVRADPDAPGDDDRLSLIEELAHRTAMAVDNARLHAQVARTAERLQRSLLPDLPHGGPLEIAARYDPARAGAEVGGDWYDAFLLPDGALSLIIGDVTGHDLRAAVAMSQIRNMLRGIACDRKEPPGKILARLDAANGILYPGQTLTCLYGLLTKPEPDSSWRFEYAVAGHPAPLLVTREGDTRFLDGGRSILLGVEPDTVRPQAVETLPPGSTVLLYTDGLIERRGETFDGGMTRLRRHAAALAGVPPGTLCDELLMALAPAGSDDIAMIAVRIPLSTGRYTATAE